MSFPIERMRRLRRTPALRRWVAETRLSRHSLVQPLFVCEGSGVERPISSLPGQAQLSFDRAAERSKQIFDAGVPAVLLFGIPAEKDATGSGADDPEGVVAEAVRAIRQASPEMIIIGDVCLCEFTDHGHCGILTEPDRSGERTVDNDVTLERLASESVMLADAGCDIIAPSAMADGQVGAIRDALDDSGHDPVGILSYAAKYASSFYGPFREAAESTPAFGDRRSYQMDPANAREAMREVELDLDEGADLIMIKPALPYLDVVSRVRDEFDVPIAAYHVSGEYAMIEAAAEKGWIDGDAALLESLQCIHRAGADIIITYGAERASATLER
jgi:porphobilinogen synthase